MTPLQMHLEAWKDCTLCQYSETRKRIVLGKGDIPCDILLVGEGPGPSENVLGLPFIGKSGKLLDRILFKALGPPETRKWRIAYNNIIACIPLVEGHEKEEPDPECVIACIPRVEEFIRICKPKLLIAVGTITEDWFDQRHKDSIKVPHNTPIVSMMHPGRILRMPEAAQSMAEHRCSVIISTAVTEYLGEV